MDQPKGYNVWLQKTSFTKEDIRSLKEIIEPAEHDTLDCTQEISGIWLRGKDSNTELRVLLLGSIRLTVSRVEFTNRRQGTMTKIYSYLADFCRRNEIHTMVIQSVETREMVNWCVKNGFTPSPTSSFDLDGLRLGDYQIDI